MKKTLVDLTYYSFAEDNPEGIISSCQSTLGFLENLTNEYDIHFVAQARKGFPSFQHRSVAVHFRKGRKLKRWQVPLGFNRFIKSLQPDCILVHGFGTAHYLIDLKMICPNAKIVLQCNGFAPKPNGIKRLVFKLADRFIDGYLFTGIDNAKPWYANNILSRSKIFAVMEGSVDFRFGGNDNRNEKAFLWVGRLDANKDPLTIVKAFQQFLTAHPEAKLTMVYHDGDLEPEVSALVSGNNLSHAIVLRGFVAHAALERLYHEHRFFILGSHYEGSGYALLEAMACGCIPVVSDIPSFRYMTDNGNCGLLFPPGNQGELVNQLRKTMEIETENYQQNVCSQFDNKLSFKAIAAEISAIFQSL